MYGKEEAGRIRSCLTVQKSKRYYNTPGRMMPGTVFEYAGKRYVLTGQRTNGQYYLAYGQEKKNIQAKKVRVLRPNARLVYVA